jgi:hypothetical protein
MIAFTTLEPNDPVRLYWGRFELQGTKYTLPVTGSVVIRWLPQPRLFFESEKLPDSSRRGLFDMLDISEHPDIADSERQFLCKKSGWLSIRSWDKTRKGSDLNGVS